MTTQTQAPAASLVSRWTASQAWPRSPALPRAELLALAAGSVVLAVITSWPLAAHMGSRIAPDLGDPIRTAWQVAWLGNALLHQPLHLWQTNAFWPHANSLAFSDSLLGYAPAGVFGSGATAALVRYNLLFLFAFALAFAGAYLLARELGAGRGASAVAGAAFAYAPFRANELGHLHVISSGGIPLSLFLLVRGYRRSSRALIGAGWLVAAWQLSLGFTLGLQFAYLLLALAIVMFAYWWQRGRPRPPQRLVPITVAGLGVLLVVTAFQARPYLQVSHDYPTARRTPYLIERYSAGPSAFLAAPSNNRVWGSATAGVREDLHSANESSLFPGAVILLLAIGGLATPLYSRRLRIGLAVGAIVCAILALGLKLTPGGWPYKLVENYFPGWDGVRTPGRLITLTSLALALLAAAGAHRLIRRTSLRTGTPLAPAAIGLALAAAVVVEGSGSMAHPRVPTPPKAQLALRGPVIELPTDYSSDRLYQFWSTDGWPKITNGNATFDIPSLDDLRGGMHDFPDAQGVQKLRGLHIYTVVLHTNLPPLPKLNYAIPEPPNPAQAAQKSIAGLGVTKRTVGSVVIYTIAH
jgi:hypothetical protein